MSATLQEIVQIKCTTNLEIGVEINSLYMYIIKGARSTLKNQNIFKLYAQIKFILDFGL